LYIYYLLRGTLREQVSAVPFGFSRVTHNANAHPLMLF
jgi:hypothetical protein